MAQERAPKQGGAHTSARRQRATDAHAGDAHAALNPILRLQRQVGNAQVARMLAQRVAENEEEDGMIQATPEVGMEGGPISDQLAGRIQTLRGGGAPLAEGVRTQMEGSFNTDFSDVRVHSGGESDSINRSISAKAFTTGNDVFLGAGASASDSGLMAHELTHVVQQRTMSASGPMTVGPAGDSYEREADSMASAVQRAPAQRA